MTEKLRILPKIIAWAMGPNDCNIKGVTCNGEHTYNQTAVHAESWVNHVCLA